MKKILLALAIIVPLLVIGVAMSMNGDSNSPSGSTPAAPEAMTSQQQAANEVIIKDFDFSPAKLTVKKGTTVTWTNRDSARHDITPNNPTEMFEASRLLAKGESYSVTFDTPGSYEYYCSPHPYMKAVIEVVE